MNCPHERTTSIYGATIMCCDCGEEWDTRECFDYFESMLEDKDTTAIYLILEAERNLLLEKRMCLDLYNLEGDQHGQK